MTNGQEAFKARIARIKSNAPKTAPSAGPTLEAERFADLGFVRRTNKSNDASDLLNEIWAILFFRYGLPILIAIIGLAALSSFLSQEMHQVMLSSVPE